MPWDEADAVQEAGGEAGAAHGHHAGIEDDDALETRRRCLMANNAWLARQWLDSLVSAFEAVVPPSAVPPSATPQLAMRLRTPGASEGALGEAPRHEGKGGKGGGEGAEGGGGSSGQQSEQHAIIVGCFAAAFR